MKKLIKLLIIFVCINIMFLGCSNNTSINKGKEEITKEEIVNKDDLEKLEEKENEDVKIEENKDVEIEEEEEEKKNEEVNNEKNDTEEKIKYITINSEDVRIPILMYHSISDADPNNSLMVPPAMFDEQMKWLSENGYTSMNLDEAVEAMETGIVPEKPIVITFDDGYKDNYTNAYLSLKKHNLKATFFVITSGVDDGYFMYSDMLKEMQANGMAIENHTENHLELNTLLKEEAYREIKNGQDYLRNVIGSKGDYLCYPVGRYSEETIEICEELGIKAAVTTEEGQASINDGRYRLKRRRIYPMSLESFQSIITN